MDLIIGGWILAMKHKPVKPTYTIRIGRDFPIELLDSPNYKAVRTYDFSDIWPGSPRSSGDILFNETLAGKILKDFVKEKNQCEALFVHCSRGKNRSPAVAIALNEYFKLGHNTEKLKTKYPDSTWYVCNLLIKVAQDLKLK